jgi:hypothetical protein
MPELHNSEGIVCKSSGPLAQVIFLQFLKNVGYRKKLYIVNSPLLDYS